MINAVAIVVIDPAGKLLLLKRSEQSRLQGWCVPGGHAEKDPRTNKEEFPRSTAVRELFEETGIQIELKNLWHAGNMKGTIVDNIIIYWIERREQNIKLSVEHQNYVWFDISMLGSFEQHNQWAGKTKELISIALASWMEKHEIDDDFLSEEKEDMFGDGLEEYEED